MTIAAGVLCSDGIVICADTEQTAGEGRYDRPKIFGCEDWLLVSGSGWSDYIKMASDKLSDEFQSTRPQTPSAARSKVEEIVLEIYDQHILKFTEPQYQPPPEMHLIVGVRCENGQLALIKTTHTATLLSSHYEVVGIGANVFEYWAKYFFDQKRIMDTVAYFCLFILREVKSAVPNCGGSSIVAKLPLDPKTAQMHTTFFTDEGILAGFPQSVIRVLLECADAPDSDFSFGQFKQMVEELKEWFKSRLEMKARSEIITFTATANMAQLPAKKSNKEEK